MDPFQALIQGVPDDAAQQQALASGLRKQNMIGQLGQLSGDSVIGPMAQQLSNTAQAQASTIGERSALKKWREGQLDLQRQQIESSNALRQQQLEAAAEQRQFMNQYRVDQQNRAEYKDVQNRGWKLQKDLGEIAPVMQSLKALDTRFKQHRNTGSGGVPGVGFGQSNWLGQGISGVVEGEEAREMQMLRQAVINPVLLQRSGAAVTAPEEYRFLLEFGSGDRNSEADFQRAIQLLKKHYGSLVQNIYGGVDDNVKAFYLQNGGQVTPEFFNTLGGDFDTSPTAQSIVDMQAELDQINAQLAGM